MVWRPSAMLLSSRRLLRASSWSVNEKMRYRATGGIGSRIPDWTLSIAPPVSSGHRAALAGHLSVGWLDGDGCQYRVGDDAALVSLFVESREFVSGRRHSAAEPDPR